MRGWRLAVVCLAAVGGLARPASAGAQARADGAPPRPHHTTWSQADGLLLAGSAKVLRSPDGYLWLAHPLGLLRFDGVRFTLLDSAHAPALRSTRTGPYVPRIVDRTGAMWVARPDGALLIYRDGTFAVAVPAERQAGSDVVADGAGRLWVVKRTTSELSRWRDGRLERTLPPAGLPRGLVVAVAPDDADGLWIGYRDHGLWHLAGGHARHVRSPAVTDEDAVRPLLHARDGALWAVGNGLGPGVFRLEGERWRAVDIEGAPRTNVFAREAVEDRDGTIWFATVGDGLLRYRDGRLERHTGSVQISDPNVQSVLLDAEGSLWLTTDAGLDRLRAAELSVLGAGDGVPGTRVSRVVEDRSGHLWVQSHPASTIYRIDGGRIRPGRGPLRVARVDAPRSPGAQLLTAARDGGAWIAPLAGGLARVDERGVRTVAGAEAIRDVRVTRAHETRDGTLWMGLLRRGVGRLRDGRFAPIPLPGTPATVAGMAEDAAGRLWVSVTGSPFLHALAGDGVVRRIGPSDGLAGPVTALVFERGDTLWAVGAESLSRVTDRRVDVVPARRIAHVLQARSAAVVVGDRLWIASEAGILHLSLAALHRIADGASEPLAPTVVTALDGIPVPKTPSVTLEPMTLSRDGRLWINIPAGIAIVDPAPRARNPLPPRVHVEELLVSGRPVARLRRAGEPVAIGPRAERIDLRFTATSLLVPERVRVEYRLDGADDEWRRAGTPRTASYTQLRPGRYRFRVRAWNEDGVPAAREAVLDFRVLPTWYQSWWFATLAAACVAASGAGAVLATQRSRERRVAGALRARFQATLEERTRLARELHDTLLQGFTGITLQLQAVRRTVERAPTEAGAALDRVLESADETLRDARQMVWDMRPPQLEGRDLADALAAEARRAVVGTDVVLHFAVRGEGRPLAPESEAAALRIGREAVLNAVRHARPQRVGVEVRYERRGLHLRVHDDGVGFDPAASPGGDGHFGLRTMRERASRAGGTFALASAPGRGTEVSAFLPSGDAR